MLRSIASVAFFKASVAACGKIFIVVNFETDKKARERSLLSLSLSLSQNVPSLRPAVSKSADADVNEDKALMRHELLEVAVCLHSVLAHDPREDVAVLSERLVPQAKLVLELAIDRAATRVGTKREW